MYINILSHKSAYYSVTLLETFLGTEKLSLKVVLQYTASKECVGHLCYLEVCDRITRLALHNGGSRIGHLRPPHLVEEPAILLIKILNLDQFVSCIQFHLKPKSN